MKSKFQIPNVKTLKDIERPFEVSLSGMKKIAKDFRREMDAALAGKRSSLKMIPTYVDRPTGKEKGEFIALDLGGTNFRVLELELKGGGRTSVPKVREFRLDKKDITGTGEDLFDFVAGCIKKFVEENGLEKERLKLGFTFSFPVEQTGIASGKLLVWTKSFSAKGVIGEDVVKLLNDALERNGMSDIKTAALVNDTVGTLAAKSYEDPDCDVGVIIGTGTNACYPEETRKIEKWNGPVPCSERMIINIEWGNFNKLEKTSYDIAVDRASDNRGLQMLEKMVSGMYMGEVTRLVMKGLIEDRSLFSGRRYGIFERVGGFKTEYMSIIEGDRSKDLVKTKAILKGLGISVSTLTDRAICRRACRAVSRRGARIGASCLAAILTKMDPRILKKHTIAIDGSVYEKHPAFSGEMKAALREIFKNKSSKIRTVLAKDGSGKGAAIIAAVAGEMA